MRLKHSFLGFIKKFFKDLSKGWAYRIGICYPPQVWVKNIELFSSNCGGELERNNYFCIVKGSMFLLNMILHHLSVLVGKSIFLSISDTSLKVFKIVLGSIFKSNATKLKCHVTDMFKRSPTSIEITLLFITFNHVGHP